MRVLLLHEESGPGGVHTLLQIWQQGLQAQGWSVDAAPVRDGRPGLLALLERARQAQVLVASNNFSPAYWAVLLGLLAQRPSVVWVHGPLQEVLRERPVSWLKRQLLRWTCRMADVQVLSSRSTLHSLHSALGAQRQPWQEVLLNPAPALSPLPPAVLEDSAQTVALGFVGRLSAEKRPERLLHMLALLPDKHHLTLVGDGPLRAALAQLASELGLGARVHFAGAQPVSAQTYQSWQATLLCSAYEGYPLAALESLAAGTPCIATPLPALREMLAPLAPGWLAPDESPQALAQTVLSALQAPRAQRQRLAQSVARLHPQAALERAWHRLLLRCSGQNVPGPKHVHFVHSGQAYLPELAAYSRHLRALGHRCTLHQDATLVPADADIVWWICGRVSGAQMHRLRHSLHVHEYASASVGPWPALKDYVKRWSTPRPHWRVFLNDWVRERLGFRDGVPCALRDMGVPPEFLQAQPHAAPDHDLVYLGEMSRLHGMLAVLRAIDQAGLRLLLVGEPSAALQTALGSLRGVHCTGRIAQSEVPAQLLRARAGLNLMPDRLPLAVQTSTKVLEYLAVGLPVLSNDYAWARQAAARHPGRIALIETPEQASAWSAALQALPARQTERQHLQALAWPQVLAELPLWAALGLDRRTP